MTVRTRILLSLGVLGALAGVAAAQPVDFSLKVSPTTGTLHDDFIVTVQLSVRGVNGPDRYWPPDFGDFVVTDQRTQQSTQWSFDPARGQEIRSVEVRRYRVKPQRAGRLKIGAARIRLDGKDYTTQDVWVQVAAGSQGVAPGVGGMGGATPGGSAGGPVPGGPVPGGPVPGGPMPGGVTPPGFVPPAPDTTESTFLHAVVDRSKVVVGEQVTVTWLLYTRSDILKFEPKPAKLDGFWVETLYEPRSYFSYQEATVGGRQYAVATVAKKALFPTKSGTLTIPPYEASVATMYTSFGAPLELVSNPIRIEVEPLPGGAPAGFDPAYVGAFTVEATVDRPQVAAGESLTLALVVRGAGAIRRTPVPALEIDGIQVHPPRDFEERVDTAGDVVRGERRYLYLLTPQKTGRLEIPPIEIPYYDPGRRRYETARTDPIALTVTGDFSQLGGGGQAGLENVIGKDIRPLREAPSLTARVAAGLHETRVFPILLGVPPLAFLLVVVVDKLRERLRRETPRARLRRARGRARKRLRVAELHIRGGRAGKFFGEIARVLNEHIEEKVGEPVSAMTRDQLREFLVRHNFPADTIEALVRELENCDFARFAPSASGPGEMRAAMRRARALLQAIEKVRTPPRRSAPGEEAAA